MNAHFRPALVLIAAFTALLGAALPAGIAGLAGVAAPTLAGGSLVTRNGQPVGSALIGQVFSQDKYFWPRPSALSGTDPKDASKHVPTPYDASESGASNLAPTAQALADRVKGDMPRFGGSNIPGDAVTSSGSGLDPDISPENAALQVARVARARGLAPDLVRGIVVRHTEAPLLGFIGAPHVNVLALNLALDDAHR